ncbi:universal stress protein [Emticicia sp. CRIBPO]|uniref:universal stress protein n=1 Tax=Emticicia sp. CRIBPO TaxID=2683258 RepID=UPI001411BB0F|nr:universal stress protein [Emticicia sp. CRIBPO]NBA85922.1 universal stress protein [Emticicia sp. CRIBPO]
MKTIIFATDFSKASGQAALTAAQIALKTGARLILFHAYRYIAPYDPEVNSLIITEMDLQSSSVKGLKRLQKKILSKTDPGLKTELIAKEGFVEDALKDQIIASEADLLVMGTSGTSPLASRFFGSFATSMLKKSPVPVLLNPPKSRYKTFENAVLALDLSKENDSVSISKMLQFFKHFEAVLNIVTVSRSEEPEEIENLRSKGVFIRELLGEQPHTFTVITGEKASAAVLNFAKEQKADLIVALPKHHNFFERLLTESSTERIALDSDVPVLAIP